jgi:murein DD-endopeptidase MepM/ murein hydrolase activator NlpD
LAAWGIFLIAALAVFGPSAPVSADAVRSETVPDEDEVPSAKPAPKPKPKPGKQQQKRQSGFIEPGPDGVVRTDPVVEPGDPGYQGPPEPRPRPRPPRPKPPVEETPAQPSAPQQPPPEPAAPPAAQPEPPAEPQPPAPPPVSPPAKPPKFVAPKPVIVPEEAPQTRPPAQPPRPADTPQERPPQTPAAPSAPSALGPIRPPEAIGEPAGPRPQTPKPEQPRPQQPQPEPPQPEQPRPEQPRPQQPQPQPPADSGAPARGLIDSGIDDAMGRRFTYYGPGELKPGSGAGVTSATIFAPGMRYPIEAAPSFPNSQVYGRGGYLGPGGGLCDASNYQYPWRDNFCETRGWKTPACPGGKGHQGQDIRAMDCKNAVHWVVAVEDGVITSIGSWAVKLRGAESGREYSYLHMRMRDLEIREGQTVRRGQRMGKVSNDFGGSPTSIHLHFEIKANYAVPGQPARFTKVPPYTSLVDSYKRLLRGTP